MKDHNADLKHRAITICNYCNTIVNYVVSDSTVQKDQLAFLTLCNNCSNLCEVCLLGRMRNKPGFAVKCKKCERRFLCASTDVFSTPTITITTAKVKFIGLER